MVLVLWFVYHHFQALQCFAKVFQGSRMESEHNDTMENKTTEEPTIEGRL